MATVALCFDLLWLDTDLPIYVRTASLVLRKSERIHNTFLRDCLRASKVTLGTWVDKLHALALYTHKLTKANKGLLY